MGLEELKAHIHQLVDQTTDQGLLKDLEARLEGNKKYPEPTDEEWARYSRAIEQAKRGEAMPADEFFAKLEARIQERRKGKRGQSYHSYPWVCR